MKVKNDNEVVTFNLSVAERLELDDVMRRLGFSTRKSFFIDVIRGILTAVDGKDRGSMFIYIPVPRTLLEKMLDSDISIQSEVIKKLLDL